VLERRDVVLATPGEIGDKFWSAYLLRTGFDLLRLGYTTYGSGVWYLFFVPATRDDSKVRVITITNESMAIASLLYFDLY
jgi:hypothetical protein